MENSVAKKYYRFGVLEGNHVEERFGLDHGRNMKVLFSFKRKIFSSQNRMPE